MELYAERAAGIDIGKTDVKVGVRVPGARPGTRHSEVRTFSSMTRGLLAARDWLVGLGVTLVVMESTGEFWKPVFYLLEDDLTCWLVNPQHVKRVPGRKTDVSDAAWLAQLAEAGLVRPSFVPPPPIRRLRDLTRYRASLIFERTREAQRLQKLLEDAGIKLSCVASDVLGVSGRAILAALIGGERDPRRMAELARGRLRVKRAGLEDALTGRFSAHHALLARMMLDRIDRLSADVGLLDEEIGRQLVPFRKIRERLITIPGVGRRTAEVILAETGADMTRFPNPAMLSSWAGMCPGNHESAGKHLSGRTRPGNPWLAGALGEAALAASRSKRSYLGERYRRLARRRGRKRALVAVGRSILESAWYVMQHNVDYADLGPDHFLTRQRNPERRAYQLATELRALGYNIELPERQAS